MKRYEVVVAPAAQALLVDAHEAARILGMSPAAVRAAAHRKSIPRVRHGRLLRFRPSDLARR